MADWIVLGRVSGLYGLRGWVKVFSYTEPRHGISEYDPLYLKINDAWQRYEIDAAQAHGKGVIISFKGVADRDAAVALLGCDIAVKREQLPKLEPGEFYWTDLQGLKVITLEGVELGTIAYLFTTGANDVVVVQDSNKKEYLIPFLRDEVIIEIDLVQDLMRVDWNPDF